MTRQRTWAALDELPAGRTLLATEFVHTAVEFSAWILISVVAFDRGGATAAGIAAAAQLIPAAIVAPAVASAGDRFARDRVLFGAMVLLSMFAFGIAVALSRDAPLVVVYAVAACFTAVLSAAPATLASLLVHHASSPLQLTICNAALATARAAGSLLGPLFAAVMLAAFSPVAAFAAIGVVCAGAALFVRLLVPADDRSAPSLRLRNIWSETTECLELVRRQRPVRSTVGFLSIARLFAGALDVVLLSIAYGALRGDGSTAAVLAAGVAGGAVAASLIYSLVTARRPRLVSLAPTAIIGGLLSVLPLVGISVSANTVVVVIVVVIIGAGGILVEVGGHTILQRVADQSMTGRVFGVLDTTSMLSEAVGAVSAGALISSFDIDASLVAIGIVGSGIVLAFARTLRRTELATIVVDPAMIGTLRTVPFFAPLPLPTLERLARFMTERTYEPGSIIVTEGLLGDEFFVLLDGSVDILASSTMVRRSGPPDFFGEIALLRDSPRTATVRAVDEVSVGVLGREPFLAAVVGTSSSRHAADTVVNRRQPDPA